jgi:hypothetical protein
LKAEEITMAVIEDLEELFESAAAEAGVVVEYIEIDEDSEEGILEIRDPDNHETIEEISGKLRANGFDTSIVSNFRLTAWPEEG